MSRIAVEFLCHECKEPASKSLQYLVRRVREHKTKFFCSRRCSDAHHSRQMKNKGNPNFGGIFHGKHPSERSPEEKKIATQKMLETRKQRGSLIGEKNGRWAGGKREVSCFICDKKYKVPPYTYRRITAGEQKACCGHNCARVYAQSCVKTSKTSIEVKMAEELTKRGIQYQEQYVLGNKFVLDFFLPEHGIVVECDGDYWHTKPDVAKRDRSKNAYVAACGYKMLRFWEREINESIEACVDLILAEINDAETIA